MYLHIIGVTSLVVVIDVLTPCVKNKLMVHLNVLSQVMWFVLLRGKTAETMILIIGRRQ